MSTNLVRIIGIDPGLRRTGWGVIESDGVRLAYVASGYVESDKDEVLAYRLRQIYEGVAGVISSFTPREAGVEVIVLGTRISPDGIEVAAPLESLV